MSRKALLATLPVLAALAACVGVGDEYTLTITKSGPGTGAVTGNGIDCGLDCSQKVPVGTMVTLTAAPAASSTFEGWSGGACSGTGPCTVTVLAATTIDARFAAEPRTLTVTKSGAGTGTVTGTGIDCGVDCSESYAFGAVVTLTAAPGASSSFAGWSGAGCSGTGSCTVTMTSAVEVTAAFSLVTNTLTIFKAGEGTGTVTGTGIDCGADCAETYASGTVVTLTAAPGASSSFAGWSGGGCSGTGSCTITMTSAAEVTATFALVTHTLTVTKAGAGTGTVTGTGIDCGLDCAESFAEGTAVTLTATAAAGSTFTGWTGDCAPAGASPTCTLSMTAARSAGAGFAVLRTLTVEIPSWGGRVTSAPPGIDCLGGSCSYAWVDGTPVTLTAAPAAGFEFTGWTGAACSGTGACAFTLTADTTVTAEFSGIRTLTVTVQGGGRVTSADAIIDCTAAGGACSGTWRSGATVSLTATPDAGWVLGAWSEAACTGPTCGVTLVSDTSIDARFDGPFDFSAATPFAAAFPFSLLAGESRSFGVTLATTRGAGLPVTLSATGLPAGVTASFSPPVVTPPGASMLTLTAAAAAPPGAATFTIAGVSGTLGHTAQATVEVRSTKGLGAAPYGLALEAGGATALVTESNAGWGVGRVVRVGLGTRLATKTVAAGIPDPLGVAADLGPARDLSIEPGGATALVVDANGLTRVTLATGAIARIPTAPALVNPHGLALIDAATALVTDCGDAGCANGRLLRVDLSAGTATRITQAISGIGDPRGVLLEAGGLSALLVERNGAGRLLRVTLAGGGMTTIASGLTLATGLALEPGGAAVLVSRANGEVTRVAIATGLQSPMMNAYSDEAPAIAVESSAATAFVVQAAPDRLLRLRLSSPIAFAAPAPGSYGALFRPSGIALETAITALVTDCGPGGDCGAKGRVVEVDLATGSVGRTVVGGLGDPRSISLEAGGTTALVALARSSRLVRVDLAGGRVTDTFDVGGVSSLRGVAAAGAVAYATGQTTSSPSGAALVQIDLASGAVSPVGAALGEGCLGRGVALEAGSAPTAALLVRQCADGAGVVSDLLRVPLDGGAATVIAAGFPPLEGVALEADGLAALVTEGVDGSDAGRVYRIELATGLTWELAAPLAAPRDLVVLATGDAVAATSDGLWGAAGAPAAAPRPVARGFDRPTGFTLEPGEATAVVATCPGPATSDCTSLGRLERVVLATGVRTAIATDLDSPAGVALEAPDTILVTDCGRLPSDCSKKGRVVRFTGTTPTVIASGLNDPALITMEDGAHALLAERGRGRILRLDLAASTFLPLVAGLSGPVQAIPEPGGATAIFAQAGPSPGLYRADLATGDVSPIAALWEVGSTSVDARIALEPGGTSALVLGGQWPSTRRSLFRVDLATHAVDLLVPGILGAPQATWMGATSGLWWTERPVASSAYRGAIVNLAVP
jgi:hypothetical protein